jgi:putative endonuclease
MSTSCASTIRSRRNARLPFPCRLPHAAGDHRAFDEQRDTSPRAATLHDSTMPWFLYLIECSDGSVYTGIATDVAARFHKHASGTGARYTRSRKPVAVLASFELADRSCASRAEYWVKRLCATEKRALAAGARTLESVLPPPAPGGAP